PVLWGHYRLFLESLGYAYTAFGETRKAINLIEQALVIARELGNRGSEGTCLGNLGNAYAALGDARKAIDEYQKALSIAREIGDHRGEMNRLGNIADAHYQLGEIEEAINHCEQAIRISREIQDRGAEGIWLGNLGGYYIDNKNLAKAISYSMQSLQIADEINKTQVQNYTRWQLAQAYLFQNDLVNACATIEAALQYDVPQNNHNVSALHGIIALRKGERETAQEAFAKSIAHADEILAKTPDFYSALDAKGLALCGLALCADDGQLTIDRGKTIAEAVETFRKARKIAPHAGVVKSMLRLFDELVKCDEEGILKDVRQAVQGQ
ncbi:MAG TPA: tetratricopeptide repeat protein, partial [Anaerolineales bacterium]|nr:tetratricopeptide repeat protein [Anaerolineales bacterium]